jgi:hypothetical protein
MIRRALLPGAVLYAGCLAGPASAQYVLAFQDYNAPHIMCKAWERGSNTFLASGEAPNERPSGERFGYYAKKYGEETGKDLNYDCERFENITPDFRRTWEPGETYQGDSGDTYTLAKAPFLPDNWSTTPTPDEIEREAAQKKAEANAPRWVVCSTYDRAANMRYVGIVIETVAAKVPDEPSEQWVAALRAKKLLRSSSEATGECKVENTADAAQSRRADYLKFDPDFSGSIQQVHWALPGGTVAEANDAGGSNEETGSAEPAPPKKSAAEIAAEERAAREAQREAEFKAKQDEYERQLVDRERRVEEFNRLTAEMERQKEANRLEAEQQLADYQKKMSEHSEQIRQHDADVAAYERQVAATKLPQGLRRAKRAEKQRGSVDGR